MAICLKTMNFISLFVTYKSNMHSGALKLYVYEVVIYLIWGEFSLKLSLYYFALIFVALGLKIPTTN